MKKKTIRKRYNHGSLYDIPMHFEKEAQPSKHRVLKDRLGVKKW